MSKYRIVYGPRAGTMCFVVQCRWLLFWVDAQGHDWIGWHRTLGEAHTLLAELQIASENDSKRDRVIYQ